MITNNSDDFSDLPSIENLLDTCIGPEDSNERNDLNLSYNIHKARVDRNLTKKELAYLANISKYQYHKIETNPLHCKIKTINNVCSVLGIKLKIEFFL